MKPLLLRHLSGEPVGRFPVWMMRQAGRYLPNYLKLREKYTFWERVTSAEIATEISLQPLECLNVDAIILFSDILTLPYSLGVPIELVESVGPVLKKPLRRPEDFTIFANFEASQNCPYVGEALKSLRQKTPEEKCLIGFAGAPWTVGTYLIEGKSSRLFENTLGWQYRSPETLAQALQTLAQATQKYLAHQVDCGAQILQLFDTWVSEIPFTFFKKHYLPCLESLFAELRKLNIPLIYFVKKANHLLEYFENLPIDVLSVDSILPLKEVEKKTKGKFSLQGNLDPVYLLGEPGQIRKATRQLVQEARELSKPAILNLGHGILKQTPIPNAQAFIEEAQTLWV